MANKRTVSIALDADIQQISQKIQAIQNQLNRLNLKQGLQADLTETITKLQQALKTASGLMGEKVDSSGMKKLQQNAEAIQNIWSSLERQMSRVGLDTTNLKKDQKAIQELTSAQEAYATATKDSVAEQKKLQKAIATAQGKINNKRAKAISNPNTDNALKNYEKQVAKQIEASNALEKARENLQNRMQETGREKADGRWIETKAYKTALAEQEKALQNVKSAQEDYNRVAKELKFPSLADIEKEEQKIAQGIEDAKKKLEEFNQAKQGTDATAFQKIREELEKIQGIDWNSLGVDFSKVNSIDDLNLALERLQTDAGERAKQALQNLKATLDQTGTSALSFGAKVEEAGDSMDSMLSRDKEVTQMRDRLVQFFSIGNSVRLFQRAIRSAFETVKELDSAMTEIAVVSDFSISDMWTKLPEFTAQANELGVAIKDTYEATTLFVQQGLDLQNSMKLSSETLKMARIAGMGAAEATDANFYCVA